MKEKIEVKNLDHLGIIAGIVDEIGIISLVNESIGVDKREKISAGKIVKSIILNGLEMLSKPLYLFSQYFQDKPENYWGREFKPQRLMMIKSVESWTL